MKQIIPAICLAILLPIAAFSQQVKPTPTPTPTPTADDAVVKIATNLIQIDVTVTDSKGRSVTGLGPEDFELFENGERQAISNLSFRGTVNGGATVGNASKPADQVTSPQPLTPGKVHRTIAIVVDDLNLSFASVYYTRKALERFVDLQMESGDLVAIIRTGGGVGALQQFTTDKRILHSAIDHIRWNPLANVDPLVSVGQTPKEVTERFNTEADAVAAKNDDSGRKTILTRPNINDVKAVDYDQLRAMNDLTEGAYAQAALQAVRYIINGMNELPGRKMMMLFSDGLKVRSDANKSRTSAVYNYLQELVDFTNRSSVVAYTFDTKGLQTLSMQASDSQYEIIDGHREQKLLVRLDEFRASQDGLAYFAGQTGGKALLNSNDLNGGIQRALDEQSGFYLLGYVPDAETFDPSKRRFNKLEVKAKRPGLNVSYRSGFFTTLQTATAVPNLSVEKTMAKALTSPFVQSEITLNINALYADDPADGAYIRSFLHIDARNLTFTDEADGWKTSSFDVAAVTFGDNGMPVENKDSKYTIRTKGATYDSMLKNGFVYVLIMPVKTPGLYQYRVAVRDAGSGKVGSASQIVEVPNLAKQGLAVSSLAVEGVTPSVWQNITQGKVGNGPGQMRVASTLLYDTVLKQFVAGNVLRYGYEVYNAKLDGKGLPHLETQVRILQNDKAMIEGAPVKFDPGPQTDIKHLKISGAALLRDNLPIGDYVLQVIVNDTSTKKHAVQLFPFEIIK